MGKLFEEVGMPRILIVEDLKMLRLIMRSYFEDCNCEVDLAESVQTAQEKSITTAYDLILMDVGLGHPDIDGFALTEIIKKESVINKNTPIVALTAHSDGASREKASQVGMVGYMVKPLLKEQLIALLDEFIYKRKIDNPD